MSEELEKQENNRNPDGTFKEGHSGNYNGRPVGSYSIVTLLKQRMAEVPIGQTKDWKTQIAEILLNEAVTTKNPRILQLIVDHMDGKPKQTIDVDADKETLAALTEYFKAMSKHGGTGP